MTPRGPSASLQTPQWTTLLRAIDRFAELDYPMRTLVVFQLAQLSYCQFALHLAGDAWPNGDPVHDRYVYEVGRAPQPEKVKSISVNFP